MSFDKEKEQLILALDLARIGFYDWKVVEDTIAFNKYMLEDWGIADGTNMTLQDAVNSIHPDDQARVNQLIDDSLKKKIPYSTEYRVIRPDGTIVWMDVNGVIQFDDADRPIRFFGTCVNITERKQKTLLLEESEIMIRTFADTMPQMAFIADASGAITYFNQRWYEYVSAQDTEGWGWKDKPIHHPDDLERTIETWTKAIASGEPYEINYRLRRHDGQYRWHLGRAIPQKNKNGEIIRWYGTNTDIHEERMILTRNQILYDFGIELSKGLSPIEISECILKEGSKVLQNTAGIVLIRNEDTFRIAASNSIPDEYISTSSFSNPEIRFPAKASLFEGNIYFLEKYVEIIKEFPDFKSQLDLINAKSLVSLPIKSKGHPIASVAFFLNKEEVFSEELKLFFESMASQAGVAVDRALLYEQQMTQKKELEHALNARDEFFSIASHELKTPLTSMRLKGQIIERKFNRNPESINSVNFLDYIQQNDSSVTKLVRLVDDMLDVSRIRSGRMTLRKENFNICDLVNEVANSARTTTESELTVDLCNSSFGNWDKLRIEQVISNLTSNAIRYGEKNPITLTVKNSEDSILLTVQDQGIGIPSDLLASIFDRYERGPSGDNQGLGLGLYISKQIVDSHGGKIWAESSLGHGSSFHVKLPLS